LHNSTFSNVRFCNHCWQREIKTLPKQYCDGCCSMCKTIISETIRQICLSQQTSNGKDLVLTLKQYDKSRAAAMNLQTYVMTYSYWNCKKKDFEDKDFNNNTFLEVWSLAAQDQWNCTGSLLKITSSYISRKKNFNVRMLMAVFQFIWLHQPPTLAVVIKN